MRWVYSWGLTIDSSLAHVKQNAVAVGFLPDLEQRVGPPARLGPSAVQVLAQGAAADEAEAVVFAEVFDVDDNGQGGKVKGERLRVEG